MTQFLVLSSVQSRILLSLLMEGEMCSSSALNVVGISGSSWSKEKRLLIGAGLLECQTKRVIKERGVIRKMGFRLTRKGKQIAQHLLAISTSINQADPFNSTLLKDEIETLT